VINKQYILMQLPLIIVLIAYLLLVQIFKMVSEKAELTNAQNLASAQLNAATKQIEQLRVSEKNFAIYRHDLRHHLGYLNACILENKFEEATAYIRQTCIDADNMTLKRYSDNEPLNLILSSYVSKAKEKNVAINVNVTAADFSRFCITDLCSLLANALENAIIASSQAEVDELRYVKLRLYERSNKLCLELRNGYDFEPIFENKIPLSQKDGHGIGVKSIIHVIDKYEGVYGFTAKNGEFCFQMSM
ncbi:MAG: GHKL domain-containing protein, partial [Oscillospiraceae bacterium]